VDLTLLVCTFNRSHDLCELLESAAVQETGGAFTYEVLVVDNNSTDDTRAVVEPFLSRGDGKVRYLFEGRQGKSYALNTGLTAAQGAAVTITDDDFILPRDWAMKIVTALRNNPDHAFVGGRILPLWQGAVPEWLDREMWSPIALVDYGERRLTVDAANSLCLIGCSFRKADLESVGGYRSDLSVSKNLIGGVEDVEIVQRLVKSGRRGLYLPEIACQHKVQAHRMTKAYYRRWHSGHGRFYALLRDEEFERSAARLFDVPAHMYTRAGAAALGWCKWRVWQPHQAFECETQLRFFAGFFRERRRQHRAAVGHGAVREVVSFVRTLLNKSRGTSNAANRSN
jgi:glycosyltransferase involved in cell wall biosynthesis